MDVLLIALTVLALVVVAPVGLRLLRLPLPPPVVAGWPAAGLLAGTGLLAPRGAAAVLLCLPYAVLCAAVTAAGALRAVRARPPLDAVRELAALTAAASLTVAASSLLAERAGVRLLGFDLGTLRLTVLHFHYAGFAAALLAGLTAAHVPTSTARWGAAAVPAGTLVVLAGFFLGEAAELLGAVVLAAGLLTTSWSVLRHGPRRSAPGGRLLAVAALAIPLTMALAVWWALGEAGGLPHPSLAQTAATHGLANALCVGLCGVLGWTRATAERL